MDEEGVGEEGVEEEGVKRGGQRARRESDRGNASTIIGSPRTGSG